MLKKLLAKKQIRFWLIGGLNFTWGMASYPLLYVLLTPIGFGYIQVLITSYVLNTIISYFTQKYLVFKTEGNHLREFAKFSGLQAMILGVNLVVLPVVVENTHFEPILVQTAFALTLFVVSYFFHNRITFYRTGA